ncbi:MAG TPA: ABC transporter permease [Thermoleophilaceae bacterium]|nr:ABC transporter permease [Thermoleophilaceae bacterium]
MTDVARAQLGPGSHARIVGSVRAEEPPDEPDTATGFTYALLHTWQGIAGLALAGVVLAVVLFGPMLAPWSPTEPNVGPTLATASWHHPLGTDTLGRDIFSRFLSGGRTVILVPLVAVTLAFVIGGALGIYAAYVEGWRDAVITRTFDFLAALPPLLLVLLLVAGLGTSDLVVTATVAIVFLPRIGRLVRGTAQAVTKNDYVKAAEARGERTVTILWRELAPNIAGPAIADFSLRLTYGVMFVASLNFLGLGVQPPSPNWGVMINEYRTFLSYNPLATIVPAVGIVFLSVAFNLLADALTRRYQPGLTRWTIPL